MSETVKVSVVLTKSDDWLDWYHTIKNLAEDRNVWKYMDPDGDTPTPTEPQEPEYSEAGAIDRNDVVLTNRRHLWYELIRKHEKSYREWQEVHKQLRNFRTAITETIPAVYQRSFRALSIREILQELRISFEPSTQDVLNDLIAKYNNLSKTPSNRSIEHWFAAWKAFIVEAKYCGEFGTGEYQMTVAFHGAIAPLIPMYTEIRQDKVKEGGVARVNIQRGVQLMEEQYRMDKTNAKNSSSSFGTFQGRKAGNGNSNSNNDSRKRPGECLCGANHRFPVCPYVNPAVRHEQWRPDAAIQQRFDAPKPPKLQATVDSVMTFGL